MFQGESRHNKPTQNVYRTLFGFTCTLIKQCHFILKHHVLWKIRQVNRILQFHIRFFRCLSNFFYRPQVYESIFQVVLFSVSLEFFWLIFKKQFLQHAVKQQGIHLSYFKTDLLFNWTRNLQGRIWTEAIIDRYQNYSTYKKRPRLF